jgi:hypothetical protein
VGRNVIGVGIGARFMRTSHGRIPSLYGRSVFSADHMCTIHKRAGVRNDQR